MPSSPMETLGLWTRLLTHFRPFRSTVVTLLTFSSNFKAFIIFFNLLKKKKVKNGLPKKIYKHKKKK